MAGPRPSIHHCPSCGGPCSNVRGPTVCEFCEGPLLPMGTPDPRHAVRCSACTALVSAGASFCPQCGDPLAAAQGEHTALACPACPGHTMASWQLQPTNRWPQGHAVHGCRRCGGVWVDRDTLDVMLESAAELGVGHGQAMGVQRRELTMQSKVVYRPCSSCGHTMMRRNFARISGVIVDECRMHGTFFDAGELEAVLAFVRSGGLLLARRRENEELARERRQTEIQASARSPLMTEAQPMSMSTELFVDGPDLGLAFVRWAGRWVRNMFR